VAPDTETTGLDVARDRIVQIGAVRGGGEALDLLVNPGVPVPESASRIHGLSDGDLAGAPGTAEALAKLAGYMDGRVVVGHNIHFDLAVLRHEAARHGTDWAEPRALDVALLAAALTPGRIDNSLDALALAQGIEVAGRHTALGDARAAAAIFAAMIEPLRERGIRSLAEAEAFQARPRALIERQEQAGWMARPGGAPDFAATGADAQKTVDGFLYRHRLADVMGAPPIAVAPDATLLETAAVMRTHGIGCVVAEPLTGGGGGFLSERDILYTLAERGPEAGALPVSEVMSRPVISLPQDTMLYRALGLMARKGLRYLAATAPDGSVSGVFTLRSLLRERALATLALGDRIAAAEGSAALAEVQAELPGLAAALLADGLDAREVAAIISAEGRAMTARAAELAEALMVAEGKGAAPTPFCLLVLGSGGRGESLLAPDQDNAVIVDDGYAGDLDAADDWFTLWAGHLNRLLDEAGIPYCKGGVMARERAWRKRLGGWCRQVDAWVANPKPENLLNVDIFFDFAPVLGDPALADRLRAHALDDAERARVLIRAMAEASGGHGGATGLFGGFRKDDRGRTDLKGGALLTLVSGARVMALARHVAATATPDRLLQSAENAGAGTSDARMLVEIHGMLLRLILTQQIADIRAGVPPSNAVDTGQLDRGQRKALKQALDRLALMDEMVRGVLG
jgi:DNA polymerase-3 subunit epsilon/CBS domain-containing protein